MAMRETPIADLKAHLSQYLAQVRRGETVVVGRRSPHSHRQARALHRGGGCLRGALAHGLRGGPQGRRRGQARARRRPPAHPPGQPPSTVTVYLDTSTGLRILLRQSKPLDIWAGWDLAYAGELLHVEACRVIDRLQL